MKLLLLFLSLQTFAGQKETTASEVMYNVEAANKASLDLADYFFTHLENRTTSAVVKRNDASFKKSKNPVQTITIDLDEHLPFDYEIHKTSDSLIFKGKNKNTLIWLFHQYYKDLSKVDKRFNADDLPPSIVDFSRSASHNFAFAYREPFYQPNLNIENNPIYGTNNLETDWGIWGHNLGQLIAKADNSKMFSTINGKKDKNQICFSSEATYNFIEDYITLNFGTSVSQNFVIAPNDNALVCTDSLCLKNGNTKTNAAPAVLDLLEKLAKRFPQHNFYTLAYLSVKATPHKKLPSNTGVLISAMDLPRTSTFSKLDQRVQKFEQRVDAWEKITPKIIIWDYTSNFDDYLSPYPSLSVLKNHLLLFKKLEINGVFCNGSGYDYSSFQDMKTYVSACLMIDPELNINKLIIHYFEQDYPVFGKELSAYYLGLENTVQINNKPLGIYAGIGKARKTYLNEPEFFSFYSDLINIIPKTKDQEKENLKKLATAFSFTYLQLALDDQYGKYGFAKLNASKKVILKKGFLAAFQYLERNYKTEYITTFKEAGANSLQNYVKEVNAQINAPKKPKDKIFLTKLKALSKLDEGYKDLSILTDGIAGFVNDYHRGWLFCSQEDLVLEIPTDNLTGETHKIEFSFLESGKLNLAPPKKIEIYANDKLLDTIKTDDDETTKTQRKTLTTTLDITKKDKLKIKFIRNKDYGKFATDEITIY